MFQRIEIDCPAWNKVGERFLEAGEFISIFFHPTEPPPNYPRFDRGLKAVLLDVLKSDALPECVPRLFPLNLDAAMRFAALDYYEFEGSLVSMLVRGGCVVRVVRDEAEAREQVHAVLEGLPMRADRNLRAFRMDDPEWSELTNAATLWSAYFVYSPECKIWWFIGFADFY